jgi:N-acetylglucosamine repressor
MMVLSSNTIGNYNKNWILKVLRERGSLSRADLSRILGISKPSISKNVKELLDAHIINEIGQGNNDVGRKSQLLVFNAIKAYVIGVDVGNFKLRIGLADLSGALIDLEETETVPDGNGKNIIRRVEEIILEVCARQNVSMESILVICIGIPGVIDKQSKKNYLAPFINDWEDFNISGYFEQKYHTKIIIENNVNIAALGEYQNHIITGRTCKNVIYVNLGIGIGAGIILDGNLYSGKDNGAGEIGFCCFKTTDTENNDKNTGVFEKMVSVNCWVPRYNQLVPPEHRVGISNQDLVEIFDRFDAGEPEAKQVIDELLSSVLLMMINVTAILNIELIIVGGGLGERMKKYFSHFENVIGNNVPFAPKIECAQLGTLSGVYGAVAIAISEVLEDYRNLQ